MKVLLTAVLLAATVGQTTSADGDLCGGLQAGDIMVTGFNMQDPDEIVLVLLNEIPEGATFFLTDRTWNGTTFLDDSGADGTLKWTFLSRAPASQEICYNCTQDGSVIDRFRPVGDLTFSLDEIAGDTIILYCMEGADNILFLSAITNTGASLPASLPNDTVTTLPFFPNYGYDGNTVGTARVVRKGLSNPDEWTGYDEYIDNLQTYSSFKIVRDSSAVLSVSSYSLSLIWLTWLALL